LNVDPQGVFFPISSQFHPDKAKANCRGEKSTEEDVQRFVAATDAFKALTGRKAASGGV
jgi:hypothetical protein